MVIRVIIGKNFGDEGKGLATDYFAAVSESKNKSCLVIRHNGGGQAGHTVDLPDKRFVFHQLSSGSFRNADTYWSKTFLPDLYKLSDEMNGFADLSGRKPFVYGHPMCRCVCIDDVLVNMALESSRGDLRHGSCGMGINEAVERSKFSDACVYLYQVRDMTAASLYAKLLNIRREYLPQRLEKLGLKLSGLGEYGEMLVDNNVLMNFAEHIKGALQNVIIEDEQIAKRYDDIIFEGAQGLLLDEDHLLYAPHLTSSKTGADNPLDFIREHLPDAKPELVYVTRSYITRHGAGPLPYEDLWKGQNISVTDNTNLTNPWQGSLRFAPHGTEEEFFEALYADVQKSNMNCDVSCMVTHLNETDGEICSISGKVPIAQWFCDSNALQCLSRVYLSHTPYSQDIYVGEFF